MDIIRQDALANTSLPSLDACRVSLCKRFFANVVSASHKLHGLVPRKKIATFLMANGTLTAPGGSPAVLRSTTILSINLKKFKRVFL